MVVDEKGAGRGGGGGEEVANGKMEKWKLERAKRERGSGKGQKERKAMDKAGRDDGGK